jgi:beta-mannosidase
MGHNLPQDDIGLTAAVECINDQWLLSVSAVKFAQFVHIDIPGFVARDDWLHVAPGDGYVTKLTGTGAAPVKPSGHVLALNSHKRVKV